MGFRNTKAQAKAKTKSLSEISLRAAPSAHRLRELLQRFKPGHRGQDQPRFSAHQLQVQHAEESCRLLDRLAFFFIIIIRPVV